MKKTILILLVSLGLQTQAQVSWCDSISYTTLPQQTLTTVGDASLLANLADSVCYTGSGATAVFQNILSSDTVKLCYDAFIHFDTMSYICMYCDSLIYDGNSWVLFSMGNTVGINEFTLKTINDNKIYDLLGRELEFIPVGKMYIRNNKLYIQK